MKPIETDTSDSTTIDIFSQVHDGALRVVEVCIPSVVGINKLSYRLFERMYWWTEKILYLVTIWIMYVDQEQCRSLIILFLDTKTAYNSLKYPLHNPFDVKTPCGSTAL